MQIKQWIANFLSAREITKPDGRPLFAYKTTAAEFDSMVNLLKNLPEAEQDQLLFPQIWLLFAAEWWKREYAGGVWGWGPIFEAINMGSPNVNKRTEWVKKAHRFWALQEIKIEGKRYIGSVAVNGGLPLRLVESAQGSLAKLLSIVIRQAVQYNLSSDSHLLQAIESQGALLPHSYQQTPIYELLEGLIQKILEIRKQYNLHEADDPIARLQEVAPNWESLFPISLDSHAAAALIKGLVQETATLDAKLSKAPFQVVRGLRFGTDCSPPIFELTFELQAQVKRSQMEEFLGTESGKLPPNFQLILKINEKEYIAGEAFLRGEIYQLAARNLPAIRTIHSSVQLIVSRWGATICSVTLLGGEALNREEPLVFENTRPFARFITQGDAVIKGTSALLLVHKQAIVYSESSNAVTLSADLADQQVLLELPESKTLVTYKRQTFYFNVSGIAVQQPEAYWQGKTVDIAANPALIFKGIPRLRLNQDNGAVSYALSHELFIHNREGEKPLGQFAAPGAGRLIWRKDGQRLFSTRAVLLDHDASITYQPGQHAFEGTVKLTGWPNLPVYCESDGIGLIASHDGKALQLNLKTRPSQLVHMFTIKLQWPGGEEQRLTLPFPSHGVLLLRDQQPLTDDLLSIDELAGCRALLMAGQGPERWTMSLQLINGEAVRDLSKEIKYIGVREIRLFELIPVIQQLLSSCPRLDHCVQIELRHTHHVHARFKVGRYSAQLSLDSKTRHISLNNGQKDLLPDRSEAEGLVLALPLMEPERNPIKLMPSLSENVFTGSWLIDLPTKIAGPWLVYSANHARQSIRPAIIAPLLEAAPKRALKRAVNEARYEMRMDLLQHALLDMAKDLTHQDWDFLESLVDQLHHLPLASLDIFQALIRVPEALTAATLMLENFARQTAERLPNEMPFEWLLIAPSIWFETMAKMRDQLGQNDRIALNFLKRDIIGKSQFLVHWQPALQFIFSQGLHSYFGVEDPAVNLLLKNPSLLARIWVEQLITKDDSDLQRMLRRNLSESDKLQWPQGHDPYPDTFFHSPSGQDLFKTISVQRKDRKFWVIFLPLVAAFETFNNRGQVWQANPALLFKLRDIRQFDMVWFDEAYRVGLALAQMECMKG